MNPDNFWAYSFEFGTYIDALAGLLLLVVGVVSYLVVLFSISYMDDQGDRRVRYFAEISLFIAAMYGLVVANSFLLMFIFWELLIFGAVLPFCIYRLLTKRLGLIRYPLSALISFTGWYLIQKAILSIN